MGRILSGEDIKIIQLFQALTGAQIRDFYRKENLYIFIVEEGQLPLALGKNKANLRRLQEVYKKKLRIVEFSSDLKRFINNLIFPIVPKEILVEEDKIVLKTNTKQEKAILIGREKKNLKYLRDALMRAGYKKELIIE